MAIVINVLYNKDHEGVFYFSKDNGTNRTANKSSLKDALENNYFGSPPYSESGYYKDPLRSINNIATVVLTKWDDNE